MVQTGGEDAELGVKALKHLAFGVGRTTLAGDRMTNEETRQTARMRRLAKPRGLRLVKSRCRTPEAIEFGGCMLVNDDGVIEHGGTPSFYCINLDEAEAYLAQD